MIEFDKVGKTYPNGFNALKDVNLKIEQGEFVAIIGLSGAGKSTLLRTINRMHDITEGKLTVDGTDVMQLKGKELRRFRRKIGMIFQSFNLVTRTKVINNVLMAKVPDLSFIRALFGRMTSWRPWRLWIRWGFWTRHLCARTSSPAGSSREWPWREPWRRIRRSSWRMSRWHP